MIKADTSLYSQRQGFLISFSSYLKSRVSMPRIPSLLEVQRRLFCLCSVIRAAAFPKIGRMTPAKGYPRGALFVLPIGVSLERKAKRTTFMKLTYQIC